MSFFRLNPVSRIFTVLEWGASIYNTGTCKHFLGMVNFYKVGCEAPQHAAAAERSYLAPTTSLILTSHLFYFLFWWVESAQQQN